MKLIAINVIFVMIVSMIATIVILMIYLAIQSYTIAFFEEKNKSMSFKEITIYFREEISEKVFREFINSCIMESTENYKCKNNYTTCYYIVVNKNFQNIQIPNYIEYKNFSYFINSSLFNKSKNNALIIFNCKNKEIIIIN
ncbi:MAG: hypothetical protein QXL82_03230 [Candidatus Aenigmatarchaeota archaeon]